MKFETIRYCVECWGWISICTSAACLVGWIIYKLSYPALSECNKCGRLFDDWDDDCICPGCKHPIAVQGEPKTIVPLQSVQWSYTVTL